MPLETKEFAQNETVGDIKAWHDSIVKKLDRQPAIEDSFIAINGDGEPVLTFIYRI